MSHLSFPNESNTIDHYDSPIEKILEGIAHEEMALANLVNAEALKLQAFVGQEYDFPTHPTTEEILSLNHISLQFLRAIVMKEWLLLSKIEHLLKVHTEKSNTLSESLEMLNETSDTSNEDSDDMEEINIEENEDENENNSEVENIDFSENDDSKEISID